MAVALLRHVIKDHRSDLAPLAHSSPIANKESAACAVGQVLRVSLAGVHHRLELGSGEGLRGVCTPADGWAYVASVTL